MKAYVHLWYIAQFFLGWEMFQTNVVEETKTQIFGSITFSKSRAIYEVMWKNMVEPDRWQYNMADALCMQDN
jgi:hypothetical protein